MRSWQSLLALLVAVVVFRGAAGADERRQREELISREELRYEGKSFAEWRKEILTELQASRRLKALEAIQQFAANGFEVETAEVIVHIMGAYRLGRSHSMTEEQVVQVATGIL